MADITITLHKGDEDESESLHTESSSENEEPTESDMEFIDNGENCPCDQCSESDDDYDDDESIESDQKSDDDDNVEDGAELNINVKLKRKAFSIAKNIIDTWVDYANENDGLEDSSESE
jgi:hypothetical protein